MANKRLFGNQSLPGPAMKPTDTKNEAGGVSYKRTERGLLAQFAATGCLSSTFYASGEDQLKTTMDAASKVDAPFIAKTAIFAREHGFMKDMPALLTAVLAGRMKAEAPVDAETARKAFVASFGRCLDNGKMLKNFGQIMRSGVVGRKALASGTIRRMIQAWFDGHTDEQLVWQSIGGEMPLIDLIKLARVDAKTPSRRALFKWLKGAEPGQKDRLGFDYKPEDLPDLVKQYEAWKATKSGAVPRVPFQMLTALELKSYDWTEIARRASWQETRQSLNTFARHGVFDKPGMTDIICEKLQNKDLIEKAKVFPYQLMTSFNYVKDEVPTKVKIALQQALEHSLSNIPNIPNAVVCPDLSGSMSAPVTGSKDRAGAGATARMGRPHGSTTVVTCREVAALVTSAILRKNPETFVLPFDDKVHKGFRPNPLDTVATNAQKLAALPGGGTNCSLPLQHLNSIGHKGDVVIYLSDYESWIDGQGRNLHASSSWQIAPVVTGMMAEWAIYKARNPKARLVCIDLAPQGSKQAVEREDILSIGGFSDHVFKLIDNFLKGGMSTDYWIDQIDKIQLTETGTTTAPASASDDEVAP
jgi:60 kDa SS-A/Ro ribonucleoprotein